MLYNNLKQLKGEIIMNLDNFLCKFLDVLLRCSRKYPDSDKATKMYDYVYEPVVQMLLPFMKEYDGSEDNKLAEILHNCRVIFLNNFANSNPIHIKRINRIIDDKKEYKRCPQFSKLQQKIYEISTEKYRSKKDKKFRKAAFESFIHDLLIEYNSLRKAIGINKLTIMQLINIDQVEYKIVLEDVIFMMTLIILLLFISLLPLLYFVLKAINLI